MWEEYQKMVDRLGQTVTGMFQSPLKLFVVTEAELRPALSLLNNQQFRYGYRLLAATISQPERNILLVTLHESKEPAKLGEIAEGDSDWFKPISRGRETLGKRFTRTVAEGTSIGTIAGTEHTQWA